MNKLLENEVEYMQLRGNADTNSFVVMHKTEWGESHPVLWGWEGHIMSFTTYRDKSALNAPHWNGATTRKCRSLRSAIVAARKKSPDVDIYVYSGTGPMNTGKGIKQKNDK